MPSGSSAPVRTTLASTTSSPLPITLSALRTMRSVHVVDVATWPRLTTVHCTLTLSPPRAAAGATTSVTARSAYGTAVDVSVTCAELLFSAPASMTAALAVRVDRDLDLAGTGSPVRQRKDEVACARFTRRRDTRTSDGVRVERHCGVDQDLVRVDVADHDPVAPTADGRGVAGVQVMRGSVAGQKSAGSSCQACRRLMIWPWTLA